jgi:hypothetical protein
MISHHKRGALGLAACVLVSACARAVEPISYHQSATVQEPEHDEVQNSQGTADYYPSRASMQRLVYHSNNGSVLTAACLTDTCSEFTVWIDQNPPVRIAQTSDPHIIVVKNSDASKVLGYIASDHSGKNLKGFPTLAEAEAYEHNGDNWRTAGKVAVGVAVGVGVLALIAGAAYAGARATEAQQQPTTVYTTCTQMGNFTNCESQ